MPPNPLNEAIGPFSFRKPQSHIEAPGKEDSDAPYIVHKAEWLVPKSQTPNIIEINSRSDLKITKGSDEDSNTERPRNLVFEVITRVSAKQRKPETKKHHSSAADDDGEEADHKASPISLDDLEIIEIGGTRIVIHSSELLNAVRRSIDYFPFQDLTGKSITIKEPYECLVHFYDRLEELAQPCDNSHPGQACKLHSHTSLCGKETKKHVETLLKYLEPTMESKVRPALEKLSRKTPVITYDMLWLLFKPGVEMYGDFNETRESTKGSGVFMAMKVYKSEYGKISERLDKDRSLALIVTSWVMCSNGDNVGRASCVDYIRSFEGEKEVTQLEAYPCSYATDKTRKADMIKRGKLAADLFKEGSRAIFFDGMTYSGSKLPRKYRGKAIIDPVSAAKHNTMTDLIHWYATPEVIPDRSPHLIELGGQANKYPEFDSLNIKSDIVDQHHLLMFPFIGGFSLDDRKWKVFHVGGIQNAEYDSTALQKLVLIPSDLNIITAISYRQIRKKETPPVDFIQGKGEGQVILLHGPPGVGKTYTVESIAGYFHRPLLSLSVADIGTEEGTMESALTLWFNLADTWNAVLLIDEADVFLERRSRDNIGRNGLVSVFLRKMEYFQGLLFLTTNRTGHIDDSFASRIHAKIHYPRLDDVKRTKIWEAFFEKLRNESGSRIFVAKTAREYVLSNPEVLDRHWNGREIRNAFQTALALAEFEASEDDCRPKGQAIEVKLEHFRQVMEMSKKFTEYVDKIEGRDEDERATARKERIDEFSQRYTANEIKWGTMG